MFSLFRVSVKEMLFWAYRYPKYEIILTAPTGRPIIPKDKPAIPIGLFLSAHEVAKHVLAGGGRIPGRYLELGGGEGLPIRSDQHHVHGKGL